MVLLSTDARKKVLQWQYNGTDTSLIYGRLLSPFADWLVRSFVPVWMAPNTITLAGLALPVAAHAALLCGACPFGACPAGDLGSAALSVTAVSMFAYQTLDNMDGKQARRTGSSSALGCVPGAVRAAAAATPLPLTPLLRAPRRYLFDHGCDAVNCTPGTWYFVCVFGSGLAPHALGARAVCVAAVVTSYVPFFFSAWEEHLVGKFVLPVINGPTEGLLLGCAMGLWSAAAGAAWWWTAAAPDACAGVLQAAAVAAGLAPRAAAADAADAVVPAVLVPVAVTFVCVGATVAKQAATGLGAAAAGKAVHKRAAGYALLCTLPCLIGLATALKMPTAWWTDAPRAALALLGAGHADAVFGLMLASISASDYNPFRVPVVAAAALAFAGDAQVAAAWLPAAALAAWAWAGLNMARAIVEMADTLGVDVFTIPYKKE